MKSGANNSDVVQIKKLAEEGYSAEDISEKLQINFNCIKTFVKASPKKSSKKPADKEEKQESGPKEAKDIVFKDE